MVVAGGLSIQPAHSQQAPAFVPPHVWEGGFVIKTANAACADEGFIAGAKGTIAFRPQLEDGEAPSAMSFFTTRSSFIATTNNPPSQMHGQSAYIGYTTSRRVLHGTAFAGNYTLTITPAKITSTTRFVTVRGNFTNFFSLTGCKVTFDAALFPHVASPAN